MTRGGLIFAQNNGTVDYIKLAVFAAARVDEFLGIPVTLVTDNLDWLEKNYPNHKFDHVIEVKNEQARYKKFYDGSLASKQLMWKNTTRSQVYDLSPYDTTLVIDSDYILNSDILLSAFDNDYDLQLYKKSFDLAGWRDTSSFTRINQYSIPFYWATTFVFRKNSVMEAFFTLITHIKDNWDYYRVLYNMDSNLYRNDYAFSIAIHLMNGKTDGNFAVELPGTMTYITDRDLMLDMKDTSMNFLVEKKNHLGEYFAVKTQDIDVHVMNKYSLTRFIDGGSGV